jgi:hypothetical protein
MRLTDDSTGGIRIELTRQAPAHAMGCLLAVEHEELSCAFQREFYTD